MLLEMDGLAVHFVFSLSRAAFAVTTFRQNKGSQDVRPN